MEASSLSSQIAQFSGESAVWYGDWVAVGGTGLVGGKEEVRWKESHHQEWAGLDWKSRGGLGDRRG